MIQKRLTAALLIAAIGLICSCAKDDEPSFNKYRLECYEYLEQNAMREEVITTLSGLQYEVLREGTGKQPTLSDMVRCHYKGWLIDGTVFDSSYDKGGSIVFPLNGVIEGWKEGLQLMKAGAMYRFYIPYTLGYGPYQQGDIPPYSALIFEVELIEVL